MLTDFAMVACSPRAGNACINGSHFLVGMIAEEEVWPRTGFGDLFHPLKGVAQAFDGLKPQYFAISELAGKYLIAWDRDRAHGVNDASAGERRRQ